MNVEDLTEFLVEDDSIDITWDVPVFRNEYAIIRTLGRGWVSDILKELDLDPLKHETWKILAQLARWERIYPGGRAVINE